MFVHEMSNRIFLIFQQGKREDAKPKKRQVILVPYLQWEVNGFNIKKSFKACANQVPPTTIEFPCFQLPGSICKKHPMTKANGAGRDSG